MRLVSMKGWDCPGHTSSRYSEAEQQKQRSDLLHYGGQATPSRNSSGPGLSHTGCKVFQIDFRGKSTARVG